MPSEHSNFNPRPPRGGRRGGDQKRGDRHRISIHALREEGDCWSSCNAAPFTRFQSTPSARRATERFLPHRIQRPKFQSTPSARRATAS